MITKLSFQDCQTTREQDINMSLLL